MENFRAFDGKSAKNPCFARFFDKGFSTFPTTQTVENGKSEEKYGPLKIGKLYPDIKDFSQLKRQSDRDKITVCHFDVRKKYENYKPLCKYNESTDTKCRI